MVDGWNAVHGAEPEPQPMTDQEFDDLIDLAAAHRGAELGKAEGNADRAIDDAQPA
jgi:hypothetical protein